MALWRHRWWHKDYNDGIWRNALHEWRFCSQFNLWSIVWKFHVAAKCGVRRSLNPKMKPTLEYHSSIDTCIPYIPFSSHRDTIKNDRATAIQIWPFDEIVTLSFDLSYWKVLFLGTVSWYAYPIILIMILVLLQKTLFLKIAPWATASYNRLLNIDTEGNYQGLTVTSSSYDTKKAKNLCHKSFGQAGTSHIFITGCALRTLSGYK